MTITANDFSAKVAEYRYFVVDIVTNEIAAEIPFAGVSFERALKGAGSFSGTIAVAPETKNLSLYDNTMPGKMALYVTRNDVCVWGGIIWSRDYSLLDRTITISASEFTSYLHHRMVWKTFNYDLEATATKTATGSAVKITLTNRKVLFPAADSIGNRTKVKVAFNETGISGYYDGFYDIEESPAPTDTVFYVRIPSLPARPNSYYSNVTITSKLDTYDYTRKLISEVFSDFNNTEFVSEFVEPGVTNAYTTTYRQVVNGIATITTNVAHGLIAGQSVQLTNVDSNLNSDIANNASWIVTDVPSSTTYKFDTGNPSLNVTLNGSELTTTPYPLKYRRVTETTKKALSKVYVTSNVVTMVTTKPHSFQVGDEIKLYVQEKYKAYNNNDAAVLITAVNVTAKTFSYSLTIANTTSKGVALADSYVNYSVPRRQLELTTYTGTPHNFVAGDHVYVSGVDDPSWGEPLYGGYHTVTAADPSAPTTWFTFDPLYDMTVEPGNVVNIKKRKYTYKNKNGNLINKVTLTTDGAHGFLPGDLISVDTNAKGADAVFDGDQVIDSVPDGITIVYKPATAAKATVAEQNSAGKITRTKASIGAISKTYNTITAKQRVGSVATITTAAAHNFVENDYVVVESADSTFNNSGDPVRITDIISTTRFSYSNSGTAVSNTASTGFTSLVYSNFGTALYPTGAACTSGVTTRTITCADHGLRVGDWITVNIVGYESYFSNGNAPVQIAATPDANTFTYSYTAPSASHALTGLTKAVVTRASYVSKLPLTYVKSYGPFANNANLGGISFSDTNYSNYPVLTNTLLGGNLTNVGDHLDKYSENIDGFEYRIDCSVEKISGVTSFKRTFVFIPRKPASLVEYLAANPLAAGEYAPPSAFGADKLIFEYPGNISSVTLQENAENSATRMFTTADSPGAGSQASPRYSAASDTTLLANGWPILDASEKVDWSVPPMDVINVDNWGNYDVETDLYKTASRYVKQSRPPMGEYTITINGSLDPIVGSYNPGDWCQVIINDDFIKERLASYLEPRKNLLLRKIESINVKVPNSPAFPEEISINLIPEWQIDTSG